MPSTTHLRRTALAAAMLATTLLGGCNTILLSAPGDIAQQQGKLIVISTVLMLLIIVPVIILTIFFAYRYRATNKDATYLPDWDHSTQLELIIWAAPLLIIIALGAVTWISTHTLDPYRQLRRIDDGKPVTMDMKAVTVQVVALDWKWLFIYPEQGIATVNELAAPIDTPIIFKITASSVMNSFYIPALAGQIYAMPGMETKLHAVMNKVGEYDGMSSNYSGAGFSGMRFKFHGTSREDFDKWVATIKARNEVLSREHYLELQKPSERDPVRRYGTVANGLYDAVLNRCVEPGKMCMTQMMAIDSSGSGSAKLYKTHTEKAASHGRFPLPERTFVASANICTAADPLGRGSGALASATLK